MVPNRFTVALLCFCLTAGLALGAERSLVDFGRWSKTDLEQLIATAQRIDTPGDRIVALSHSFLNTPYVADTLIGGPQKPEQLVIDLAGIDCFTFLDLIEALRRTSNLADFPEQLKQVRYRGGHVAFENRHHFFSDWVSDDAALVDDVTVEIGQGRTRPVVKRLNLKADGNNWLLGIPVTQRAMAYIPTDKISREMLSTLHAGDYVGIYSELAGLDVSHVGLVVKEQDRVILRHASSLSSANRVVDVDLLEYLQGKPGLVVYRVRREK